MTMLRWNTDVDGVRSAMERFMDDGSWPRLRAGDAPRPVALDMYESDADLVVKAALPGFRPEDVEVTVEQGTLTIRARRTEEKSDEKARWLYRELFQGEYARSITLPSGFHGDKAEATFDGGILTLRIPKAEEARPRQIKIAAKAK